MARKTAHQKATSTPIVQAAVYLRVSTEEQATEGYGLDVQRERCRAQAVVKGWQVVTEYADEGISGTKEAHDRPGLAALLAAVEARTIDAVIILSLDRLGRRARITLDLVDRIVAAGVDLVSCKESLDTTTAAGRLVVGFFAIIAQWERDTIVERTTAGRNERGKKDGEKGGKLPYGYVRGSSGVETDSGAAGTVRRIFALRKKQRLSYRAIVRILEIDGVPGPRGGRWHPSSIAEILANEAAYRGGMRGESTVCWPRILK